jgi:hypothetical protein
MEPMRVDGYDWPHDGTVIGGQVCPQGERLDHWSVTALHARYAAPAVYEPWTDGWGRTTQICRRRELLAFHVDLEGQYALPALPGMLLYQVPPFGYWMLRPADAEQLGKYEQYRVAGDGSGGGE